MPIEIASYRFKEQYHNHRCPSCKRVLSESNHVCGKISGDHVFRCLTCLSGYWRRFGDSFMDTYLTEPQFDRLKELAPDQASIELDQRDMERARKQAMIATAVASELEQRPQRVVTPEEIRRIKLEQEQVRDETEVITYEEAEAEMAKIRKEEEI